MSMIPFPPREEWPEHIKEIHARWGRLGQQETMSIPDTPPRQCEYYTLRFQGQFFESMLDDAQVAMNALALDGWRLHTYTVCELADAGPTIVVVMVRDRSISR